MAKKKKEGVGRKPVKDKIVQVQIGIRRTDWEKMAGLKWPDPSGSERINKIIKNALIRSGYVIKH